MPVSWQIRVEEYVHADAETKLHAISSQFACLNALIGPSNPQPWLSPCGLYYIIQVATYEWLKLSARY